jgi:hypothetical protein
VLPLPAVGKPVAVTVIGRFAAARTRKRHEDGYRNQEFHARARREKSREVSLGMSDHGTRK